MNSSSSSSLSKSKPTSSSSSFSSSSRFSFSTYWTPKTEGLETVLDLLRLSALSDNEKQKEVYQKKKQLENNDEFPAYCARVFIEESQPVDTRQRAGFLMKTCLDQKLMQLPTPILRACQEMVLTCVSDPCGVIQKTASVTIAAMVRTAGLAQWPSLLENLLTLLKEHSEDTDAAARLGIITTFELLLEDTEEVARHKCCESILSALLHFSRDENVHVCYKCLEALLHLFQYQPLPLIKKMDVYAKLIIDLMKERHTDTNIEIIICDTLIITMIKYWDLYRSNILDIFKFMLMCTKSSNEQLAIEAVEFWPYYAKDPHKDQKFLKNFLPDLCPVLIHRIRYTPALLELIDWESDDCSKAIDREEDIRPLHYQGRFDKNEPKVDQETDEDETKWNIRKACANVLDLFTTCSELAQPLLKHIGPLIVNYLQSSDYLDREAGLLTLGALCAHGYHLIIPQLPKMIPYILQQMKDEHILVVSIACWAISRVSIWFDTRDGKQYFKPVLMGLLHCMGSKSKRVQRSACGALAEIAAQIRKTSNRLADFVQPIVGTFVKGLELYRLLNFHQLVDVIGTVCDVWSLEDINIVTNPKLIDALTAPLLKRWLALEENSTSIFPIMECVARFTVYMGPVPHFQKTYVPSIFQQALQLGCRLKNEQAEFLETVQSAREEFGDLNEFEQHIAADAPNPEYWVSSLDILSALCEKAQPQFTELAFGKVVNTSRFVEMLYCAAMERYIPVRRNAFALLGDLIIHCSDQIGPHIGKFMPLCIENLQPNYDLVCTNASWCIGVALEKYRSKMNIYWKKILQQLIFILKADETKIKPFVKPNAAITLARLACTFPEDVIQAWDTFAVDWMVALTMFPQDKDKLMAFQTLLRVINTNPKVVVGHKQGLVALFRAIGSWKDPPQMLQSGFTKILNLFKNAAGNNWESVLDQIHDKDIVAFIRNEYHV